MRIAFIANPEAPGGWYRGIGPMLALGSRGHDIVQVWRPEDGIKGERIAGCEVVHVYREHGTEVQEIVRHAKANRVAVVYDNDDDMRAVPRNVSAAKDYGGFAGDRALREIRRIVRASDLAIATTPTIAERFREYGGEHVEVIENYVQDVALQVSARPNGDHVVAGWIAGAEHHVDIELLPLREQLERALEAYPQLVVESVGVGLGLRHERFRHTQHVDFFDLPAHVAQFDIGFAPIADIPFNQARSSIKVKEYAAVGLPWLASPVGPYAPLGEQQGGRLVPDDGWFEALGRLVDKPRERRKLAKRARKWGREQAMSANIGLWERAISEAVVRTGRTPRPPGRPRPMTYHRPPPRPPRVRA